MCHCGLNVSLCALLLWPVLRCSWPDWAKSNFAQNSGHDAGMVARGPLPVVYLPWQSISKLGPLVESLNAANVPSEVRGSC